MRWVLALTLTLLAGCAVGPDYRPPAAPSTEALKLSEAQVAAVQPTPLPPKWWRLFDDPALDRLVEAALSRNTDLREAVANLQRARAVLSEARADRLPTNDLTAQYTRQRFGGQVFGDVLGGGAGPLTTDFFNIGTNASYEVDLFGGVRRSFQAAQAQVDAARVSVAAETASAYARACALAAQAAVARETERLQLSTLDLTERLYRGGRGTERDVQQARALLEQARAQTPAFEAERRASLAALAVLTGLPPFQLDMDAERCAAAPTVRQPIPVGDGQALLARRPDVRAAERTLAADTARIGVATAALYPRISLLGAINLGSTDIGDIGNGQSLGYSFGPLISWNIPFNGAARARVRQAEASAKASLAAFDGTVLRALQETEQALARLAGAAQRESALVRAEAASGRAAQLAAIRYRAGSDSFLQLLDAERERAAARAALAQVKADRAEAQVALFRALGGGWEEAPAID
jgi:NodT family efflux transporter outer membrane factor (OMF) lipoprotein